MTPVGNTPNRMQFTETAGLVEVGQFDAAMRTQADLSRPALPAQSSATRPLPPGEQALRPIRIDGRTFDVPERKVVDMINPKNPADVTQRVVYRGQFDALPKPLQDRLPGLMLANNPDPEYTAENLVPVFRQPGKEIFAITELQKDGTESLLGMGAAARGHGIESDGSIQNILYEQHLVSAGKGAGVQVKEERMAFANDVGSHLFFMSAFPLNEQPGAAQSRQKGQLDWSMPTHIEDPIRRSAQNETLATEIRDAYGLPPGTPLDVTPPPGSDPALTAAVKTFGEFVKPIVIGKTPYVDPLGHDNETTRPLLHPELAGKTWQDLTPEQKSTVTAAAKTYGREVGPEGNLVPKFHVDGTQVSQTPALGWLLNLERNRDGTPRTADHPVGTETQMGRIMPNGPHKEVDEAGLRQALGLDNPEGRKVDLGLAPGETVRIPRLPAYYIPNQGKPGTSEPTTSFASAPFGRSGVPPTANGSWEPKPIAPRQAEIYSLPGSQLANRRDDTRAAPPSAAG